MYLELEIGDAILNIFLRIAKTSLVLKWKKNDMCKDFCDCMQNIGFLKLIGNRSSVIPNKINIYLHEIV